MPEPDQTTTPVPLSVAEHSFLTFDQIPADLNRGIVPVFEARGLLPRPDR